MLCVETNGMERFFAPTLLERIYLFWVFRNFRRLSLNVLSEKNRACIERVCGRPGVAGDPDLVVGVVECELALPKKSVQPAVVFPAHATHAKRAAR
jgi:hypothetical protein